jgi:(p)ppGpp synthase/HD superfamily hydrolase
VGPHLVRDAGDLRPIAHRLGLNQTYRELQDLSFKHLHPWRYATLEKAIAARARRRDLVQRVQDEVSTAFATHSLPVRCWAARARCTRSTSACRRTS